MPQAGAFPTKNPDNAIPLDPDAYFPLTRHNMRRHLELIVKQFLSFDMRDLQAYRAVIHRWYMPDAVFDYPAARCEGRDSIAAFWDLFLIGRKLQLNNVHSLDVEVLWDSEKLQAFLQVQSWQHITPLKWIDWVTQAPGWKVWSSQLLQFEESPADGPGALRISYQRELIDQFVFCGLIPVGIYEIKADPGTVLHAVLTAARRFVGWSFKVAVDALEPVTQLLVGAMAAASRAQAN